MPIVLPIIYKNDPKGLKEAEQSVDAFSKTIAAVGVAAAAAFAAASVAAIAFGVSSVKAAVESEKVVRGLENAAKNAAVFGDSSADIDKATKALDDHSTKLGELIGIDDELLNQQKMHWLAVPSLAALGTAGINKLAEVTADVAAGTGKDIDTISQAFIKVAGSADTAITKLKRSGIVFTKQQEATYQSLLDTNKETEAQAYLIEQLGIKYAGAAKATADPFQRLKVTFDNLKETIGKAFLPVLEATVPKLQDFINSFVTSPEFKQFVEDLSKNFAGIMENLPSVLSNLGSFIKDILTPLESLVKPGGVLSEGLLLFGSVIFGVASTDASGNTKKFSDAMGELAGNLDRVAGFLRDMRNAWDGLPDFMKMNMFDFIGTAFSKSTFGMPFQQGNKGKNFDGSDNNDGNPFTAMAHGGLVMPRPGGTLARIGEAGQAEAVIPLSQLNKYSTSNNATVVINGNVGWSPSEVAAQIMRKQRQAQVLNGLNGMVAIA